MLLKQEAHIIQCVTNTYGFTGQQFETSSIP